MNIEIARQLNRINTEFYQAQAASFSQTRQAPWQGWEKVVALMGVAEQPPLAKPQQTLPLAPQQTLSVSPHVCVPVQSAAQTLTILDVAAGNLRFGHYLASVLEGRTPPASTVAPVNIRYVALDNSLELAQTSAFSLPWQLSFSQVDLVEELLQNSLSQTLQSMYSQADATLCFGFVHHVPTGEARKNLVHALLEATRPQGLVALSLWQFMNSPKLASRAQETTEAALKQLGLSVEELDPDDYILGWQEHPGAWRYCHHFEQEEIRSLVESVRDLAELEACYSADGRTGNLNTYLVLRKKGTS